MDSFERIFQTLHLIKGCYDGIEEETSFKELILRFKEMISKNVFYEKKRIPQLMINFERGSYIAPRTIARVTPEIWVKSAIDEKKKKNEKKEQMINKENLRRL